MTESRVLLDFEVEAHGCLVEGLGTVVSRHPNGDFEVNISNLAVAPGTDRPLLSVQLLMPGEDLRAAEKPGTEAMRQYLNYLTFITSLTFRVHRLVRIVDWTQGLRARRCVQFERFQGHGLPLVAVDRDHIRSTEVLQQVPLSPALQRALKWFSSGVSARYSDDQFQFFWWVLELVAQSSKDSEKVNDLCPQCRKPLYCEACENYPTHRPYPKQAIEQIFSRFIQEEASEFFEVANGIRNGIMHGDSIDHLVEQAGRKLHEVVDELGRLAWTAILNELVPQLTEPAEKRLAILRLNTYSHQTLRVAVDLTVFSRNPDNPTLDELAKPEIGITYGDLRADE